MGAEETKPRYFIDLKWYEESKRSFSLLAQSRLCPSCRERFASAPEATPELLLAFRDCCSKRDDFFSPKLPLLEAVFRLFLGNGNQPLELEQISEKLKEWLIRTGDTRDVSVRTLKRLMDNDRYYGFRPFPEEEAANNTLCGSDENRQNTPTS